MSASAGHGPARSQRGQAPRVPQPAIAPGMAEGSPGPPPALRKTRRPMEGMADPWAQGLPADPIMPAMATMSAIFLPRRSASCIEGRAAPARPCMAGPGAKALRITPPGTILCCVLYSTCSGVAQAARSGATKPAPCAQSPRLDSREGQAPCTSHTWNWPGLTHAYSNIPAGSGHDCPSHKRYAQSN